MKYRKSIIDDTDTNSRSTFESVQTRTRIAARIVDTLCRFVVTSMTILRTFIDICKDHLSSQWVHTNALSRRHIISISVFAFAYTSIITRYTIDIHTTIAYTRALPIHRINTFICADSLPSVRTLTRVCTDCIQTRCLCMTWTRFDAFVDIYSIVMSSYVETLTSTDISIATISLIAFAYIRSDPIHTRCMLTASIRRLAFVNVCRVENELSSDRCIYLNMHQTWLHIPIGIDHSWQLSSSSRQCTNDICHNRRVPTPQSYIVVHRRRCIHIHRLHTWMMQTRSYLPTYPWLHRHRYVPTSFSHVACASHNSSAPPLSSHSLISTEQTLKLANRIHNHFSLTDTQSIIVRSKANRTSTLITADIVVTNCRWMTTVDIIDTFVNVCKMV